MGCETLGGLSVPLKAAHRTRLIPGAWSFHFLSTPVPIWLLALLTAPDLPCLLLIGNYRPAWTLCCGHCPRPAPHRTGPRYCRGESARRTGVPLRDAELLLPPCCRCAPRPRFSFAAASLAPTTKSLGLVWLLLTRGFAVATLTGFAPLPQTNRPAGCCYFEAVLDWVFFLSLLFP